MAKRSIDIEMDCFVTSFLAKTTPEHAANSVHAGPSLFASTFAKLPVPMEKRMPKIIVRVAAIVLISLFLTGCDKCGDWLWSSSPKSCHSDPSVK